MTLAPFLNTIRKNVAILTRSLGSKINTDDLGSQELSGVKYYKITGGISDIPSVIRADTKFTATNTTQSLIVEGANVTIDADILTGTTIKKPRAIIVLAKEGKGGNIYIKGNVKNIYATLIAEGSIYSGLPPPGALYNDTKAKVANLPANQLYIFGSLLSHNTIG